MPQSSACRRAEHAVLSSALLARGVPLLVEKPLAASVEEGERLVQEAEAAGASRSPWGMSSGSTPQSGRFARS